MLTIRIDAYDNWTSKGCVLSLEELMAFFGCSSKGSNLKQGCEEYCRRSIRDIVSLVLFCIAWNIADSFWNKYRYLYRRYFVVLILVILRCDIYHLWSNWIRLPVLCSLWLEVKGVNRKCKKNNWQQNNFEAQAPEKHTNTPNKSHLCFYVLCGIIIIC